MASDGSGGIVYRKRVEGRAHIFAAPVRRTGSGGAPQRVDVGEPFESSFPAIAAGEGGRLVVVWTNHYSSTTDGLFSATLEPGSTGFQPPVPVDLNIGQATGTYPSVAMNLAGAGARRLPRDHRRQRPLDAEHPARLRARRKSAWPASTASTGPRSGSR